jgi:ubiquinone/menaquinone biosynthesis C-methylase UbiE
MDVGGGASTLVDDLLDDDYECIAVVDISTVAIERAKERLGTRAKHIEWIAGDITQCSLPFSHYDLWHDRAVFHFLTEMEDRRTYVNSVMAALKPGGFLIVAGFALTGPERCSGLDVVRHSPDSLQKEFGKGYRLLKHVQEDHCTPSGARQDFVYCLFKRDETTDAG